MHKTIRLISTFAAAGLLAVAATGCSPKARRARLLERANRDFDAGQYDQAEIEYMNVLKGDNLNPQAIGRLGSIYFDQGRTARARPFLLKARELRPDNLDARFKLGLLYLASGQRSEARNEAGFVLARRPQDPGAPALLADASIKSDEIAEARQRLQGLPPPASDSAPVLVAIGSLDFRQRHLKQAEEAFLRAQSLDPKSGEAWAALGVLRLAQNNLPSAEQAFKKAAELSPARSPRRMQYAEFKLRTGEVESGRRLLEEMTRTTPDFLPPWIRLAEISATDKKYDDGLASIARVLARDPANPEAMLLSGRLHLAKGESAKAVADFEKMLSIYPKSPQANYQLGLAHLAGGDVDKAVDLFNQVVSVAPDFTEASIMLANLNIRQGDLSAAVVGLKKVVQKHPEIVQAQLLLADAYRGQGNLDEALAVYRKLQESNPRSPQLDLLTGLVLVQQNKPDDARQAFTMALELAPEYLPPLEQLVNLDLSAKHYAAALQRVQSHIAKTPKLAGLQLLLAKIYLVQQDMDQAEAALHKAVELQPESTMGYFLLARLYVSTNQQQKALANLDQVIAKNPKDVSALMLTGMIHDQQKNYTPARDAYEKLLTVDPKFAPALNNLAYLYSERLNQSDRAFELAQRARELLPTEPHAADTLGWILFKRRQYPGALTLLEESAANLPGEADVQYHLGMTHYMMGEEMPARLALQRALQLNKEFLGADEARQSLSVLEIDAQRTAAEARPAVEKSLVERKDDPVALARLAALYEKDGAVDKAIATWESAAKAGPANVNVLMNQARLYAARGDSLKAIELAKSARKLAPDNPDVAHTLGRLAFQTGDHAWAASLLQEAAGKLPDDPETLSDFAEASYSVGRVADAENTMRRALSLSDGQTGTPFARADRARSFLDMVALSANPTQAAAATDRIEQALKIDPADVPALMAMAVISEQKSDAQAAKKAYEKALSRYPDFAPAKRRLAILYAQSSDDNQKAYDLAVKARETYPDDPELTKAIGIIVYRQGDFARAAERLQESASKRGDDAELLYYLGMAQFHLKQTAVAKQTLQRALGLNLAGDLAATARKTLAEMK